MHGRHPLTALVFSAPTRKVSEVTSMTDFQYRGSVLLKDTSPEHMKIQGEASKRCQLHKVHELLSPDVVAKLEKLRKRCSGKLMGRH